MVARCRACVPFAVDGGVATAGGAVLQWGSRGECHLAGQPQLAARHVRMRQRCARCHGRRLHPLHGCSTVKHVCVAVVHRALQCLAVAALSSLAVGGRATVCWCDNSGTAPVARRLAPSCRVHCTVPPRPVTCTVQGDAASVSSSTKALLTTVTERKTNAEALQPALANLSAHIRSYHAPGTDVSWALACVPVVASAMATHPNSSQVQAAGLLTLAALARDAQAVTALVKHVEQVVAVMGKHRDQGVQASGLEVLAGLASVLVGDGGTGKRPRVWCGCSREVDGG